MLWQLVGLERETDRHVSHFAVLYTCMPAACHVQERIGSVQT